MDVTDSVEAFLESLADYEIEAGVYELIPGVQAILHPTPAGSAAKLQFIETEPPSLPTSVRHPHPLELQ